MRPLALALAALLLACATPSRGSRAEEGFVEAADGARLWYRKLGSGEPVVVVPGAFMVAPPFDGLAQDRTVVLYDLRNRGRSSPVDVAAVSIEKDVEDLEAVRAHVGARRIVPVGWSYLGKMVALYARAHPDRVARVVQLAPVPPRPDKPYEDGLSVPPERWPDDLRALAERVGALRERGDPTTMPEVFCREQEAFVRRLLVVDPARGALFPEQCGFEREWPASLERHFVRVTESIAATPSAPESFRSVRVPVLVVHGREDRNAPYGGGRDWAATWPDARLVTVDRGAHAPWLDDPRVLDDVRVFLDGKWPERAADVRGGFCGGFAAIRCPEGGACVDDPRDDCDPERGGADCGGVCLPR